ncbi:MAG: right-handed parallel beta-helix repeat-containing protein, partial [Planctomycetes bacterium]|nr:right-handed parallel beta-helix repeat-containing protein [Planctomycetota bacterium]
MPHQKIRVQPVLILLTVVLACAARAGEVSWVLGTSSASSWSLQPSEPNETALIRFSGPTRLYANQFLAEQALGGKPVLQIDTLGRKIQLRFEPPARSRADGTQSVCGLQGYFGPLEQGPWQFFCTQPGAAFTLPFEVRGQAISAVYYVDARATGTHDGSSWTNAFALLQDILAVAGPGSEIRVAQGIYRPDRGTGLRTGDIAAAFVLKSGVVLKGGYAGVKAAHPDQRDVAAYETVLSGDLLGNDDPDLGPKGLAEDPSRSDNSLHVLMIMGTDSTAVLDGFTITGGHAFVRQRTGVSSYGGGLYIETASPIIRHCLITGNAAADYGGGLYARGQGVVTLIDSALADNWSGGLGGGVFVNWDGAIHLERCLVSGNAASLYGGGLSCYANGSLYLSNSIVSGNVVLTSRYGAGGGLYCSYSTAALNHSTFIGNSAPVGPGVACCSTDPSRRSRLSVANCILWDPGSIANQDESAVEVTYSDVYGGWTGPGNLNVEPGFLAAGRWDPGPNPAGDTWSDGDYHLAWESPCVDAGDPCAVADAAAMDFGGQPRFSGLQVDMGAYELRNDPPIADAGPDVAGFLLKGDKGT